MSMTEKESNQAVLNAAVAQMRKQKTQSLAKTRRCEEDQTECAYRGDNGVMCAFGACIADYDPRMEGISAQTFYGLETVVTRICVNTDRLHPWARNANPGFAQELQSCHDSWNPEVDEKSFLEYFERNAREAARAFELEYPA